ncbi:flagellar export chaperone FliS [uncultured Sphingomonas sp.]|uniref:flagellar export chaperone FliS n=1 Tax=uncultured Sphingomonas sp. TaxID=158754 RepID=UPI0025D75A84|nr:flagellar export chaperone FliS [uncultured Sphingomonas sp.]
MFGAPSRYGAPGARYRDIDVAARVEGASPHGLVQILFDELQKGLETLRATEATQDHARRNAAQARVLSILHGLEASLDYQKGGEIADNLGKIYREGRRLISTSGSTRPAALEDARRMLGDIATAWSAIS